MTPFSTKISVFFTFFLLFSYFTGQSQTYDFVVDAKGTGNFRTVQAAIDSAPAARTTAFRIFIKNGKYKEKITVPSNKPFIQLIGESVANTILTFDDFSGKPMPGGGTFGTSNSASFTINATDFFAANITFENTTGEAPQALAINVSNDRCAFVNCRFLGGQDTVLANGNTGHRQYFKNCYIDGTVDFIFGSARAVFDSCVVYGKDRSVAGASYITAANTQAGVPWGYVFRNCVLPSNRGATSYFLGRPWQNDGTTTPTSNTKVSFLNTKMGATTQATGWSTWNANTNTALIFYGEYKTKKLDGTTNYDVSQRVTWSKQISDSLANTYVLDSIFSGWKVCEVSPLVCGAWAAPIAVTNFRIVKGAAGVPSALTWNASWGINGVAYEVLRSTDNKATFSRLYQTTATNDTAIVFGTTDTIPSPNRTFHYIVRASKTGLATHVSDTLEVSSIPTVIAASALGSFLQGVGTPSKNQSYVFSGINLVNPVVITPPANFQISNDGGTTWRTSATPLSITPPANGVLPNTTILVRLNGTAVGTYTGNITHISTNAATVNVAVTGTIQANPIPVSDPIVRYSFAVSGQDSTALRATGVTPAAIRFSNMSVSNGTTVATIPAYSPVLGMSFAAGTDGSGLWTTAAGGNGGNLNRSFYVEYKITAAASRRVRVDSMVFNLSYVSTASNTRLAIVYSTTGFATDSANITGGIGPDGQPLAASANGTFAAPVLALQENASTTNNYRFALNGATGVTLQAGQTLTIRTYHACGSTSNGRYAKIKDLAFVGESRSTVSTQETPPSLFSLSPNPASTFLMLQHPTLKGTAVFSIYDLSGKKLLSQKTNGDTTRLNIEPLVSGVYLVECQNEAGGKSVVKFVKQ
jgi:pectin methylesterase-like acyl-CoA thioesterase